MELSVTQQFFDSIKKANSIILALPQHLTVDLVASGLGLSLFLRQPGKKVVLASSGQLPQGHWEFLPEAVVLASQLADGKQLVISVNTREHELDELSYQTASDKLEIFLKAKAGSFTPEDVSLSSKNGEYDLIITLGASSLEDLGALYQNNAELFFSLPKINIGVKPDNEYFGTINLIDVTASSLGELLAVTLGVGGTFGVSSGGAYGGARARGSGVGASSSAGAASGASAVLGVGGSASAELAGQPIMEDVATCFLAGIIAKTHSFQQPQTTPQTLTVAADLIQRGAHQQDIIVALYKTKDFSLLKLWGRALARLKTDEARSLLYTTLNADDFARTGSGPEQLVAVLREFIDNMSGYQVLAVMGEIGEAGGQSGYGGASGAAATSAGTDAGVNGTASGVGSGGASAGIYAAATTDVGASGIGKSVRILIAAPPHIPLSRIAQELSGEGSSQGSQTQVQEPQPLRGAHNFISVDLPGPTSLAQAEAKLLESIQKP